MRKDIKTKALRRLNLIRGQIEGLRKMIDTERYCIDIITQSWATKAALSGIEDLLLENHLTTHVVDQMKSGHQSKVIKEILSVYKVSKRK